MAAIGVDAAQFKGPAPEHLSLDDQIAVDRAHKYAELSGLEAKVVHWIEYHTGESKGSQTIGEWLHNGKVLCSLANKIQPGSVKKINETDIPAKQRENIGHFQAFCRRLDMAECSMFSTNDVYDQKNMGTFIQSMNVLGGLVQEKFKNLDGPKLGVPVQSKIKDEKRTGITATQMGGLSAAMEHQPLHAARRVIGVDARDAKQHVDGHVHGLHKDVEEKALERLQKLKPLEEEIVTWIQVITGCSKGEQSTSSWLKDGRVLCQLANKIVPGAVPHINEKAGAFKERENITKFQRAMRHVGVPESSMFGTDDLYEEKDLATFLLGIGAYAGAVQARPGFAGPALGPKVSHFMHTDQKRSGLTCTSQYVAMEQAMEVERPKETGPIAGAKAAGGPLASAKAGA